jgi:predicted nucleic acid-binding protein
LRYVFDTNVLISALLLPDSTSRHALDLALRKGTVLISFAALAELCEVLSWWPR